MHISFRRISSDQAWWLILYYCYPRILSLCLDSSACAACCDLRWIDSNCGFLSEIALYCSDCGIEIPPNRELTTPSKITVCQTCFQKRLSTGASRVSEIIVKQSIPNTLGTRLLLPKDEQIRFFSSALRFLPTEGYNKQTQAKAILNSKSRGWFLLTDRRVIYLQRNYAPSICWRRFRGLRI